MKRRYEKPEVRLEGIDSEFVRMLNKDDFIELFWEKLKAARKEDPLASQEKVFEEMNKKYQVVTGSLRYSSFNCFRNIRDRK